MKLVLTIIHFLIFLDSFGQLPSFETNMTGTQIENSILRKEFHDRFPTVISFSQNSFWFKRHKNYVFAFDGKDWSLIKWSFELSKKGIPKKQKQEQKKIDENAFLSFIDFLEEVGFYDFSQDSLNLNERDLGNGQMLSKQILDGTTDKFEIFSSSGHRSSTSHEAEFLQKFVQTNQRKNFIECKRRILEIIKEDSN
ncbi:hypothetical protein [Echinicola sp. 20G]|uniref:hypothetical protein n=1 Tax=Echinicola sp. 20G TaxID=2781961 RepID=UPI00191024F3|nr:hypothetical protein [Echinicola sp. 20G]